MAKSNHPRALGTRTAMMPRHCNGAGHIFGGTLLSEIDVAGAIAAGETFPKAFSRLVTRAMDKIEFKKSVEVNDVVTCWGTVTKLGRTSLTVHVEVEANRGGEIIPVTEAHVVYVSVDAAGKSVPLKGVGRKSRRRPAPSAPPAAPLDPKKRILCGRRRMMPMDQNGAYNVFGGVLLSEIDLAGSYAARRVCANQVIARMVTRFMDKVEFKQPVLVDDVITCWGTVTRMGTTSVTVHVDVEADRQGTVIPVTSADLVFVALDESGRPTPITCPSETRCSSGISTAPKRKRSRGAK